MAPFILTLQLKLDLFVKCAVKLVFAFTSNQSKFHTNLSSNNAISPKEGGCVHVHRATLPPCNTRLLSSEFRQHLERSGTHKVGPSMCSVGSDYCVLWT